VSWSLQPIVILNNMVMKGPGSFLVTSYLWICSLLFESDIGNSDLTQLKKCPVDYLLNSASSNEIIIQRWKQSGHEGCVRNMSWPILMQYSSFHLQRPMKNHDGPQNIQSVGQVLFYPGSLEYKVGTATTKSLRAGNSFRKVLVHMTDSSRQMIQNLYRYTVYLTAICEPIF
jgi:hypothetical protein